MVGNKSAKLRSIKSLYRSAAFPRQFEVHLILYNYVLTAVPFCREKISTPRLSSPLHFSGLSKICCSLLLTLWLRANKGLPQLPDQPGSSFPGYFPRASLAVPSFPSLPSFLPLNSIAFENWLLLRLRGTSRTALNYARVVPHFQCSAQLHRGLC